jgi:hypothetical protein
VALILIAIVIMVAAQTCLLKAYLVSSEILDEVNTKLPSNQQISPIFVNWKAFDIQSQHAALFPSSKKRKQLYIWSGCGTVLILAFASLLPAIVVRFMSHRR